MKLLSRSIIPITGIYGASDASCVWNKNSQEWSLPPMLRNSVRTVDCLPTWVSADNPSAMRWRRNVLSKQGLKLLNAYHEYLDNVVAIIRSNQIFRIIVPHYARHKTTLCKSQISGFAFFATSLTRSTRRRIRTQKYRAGIGSCRPRVAIDSAFGGFKWSYRSQRDPV